MQKLRSFLLLLVFTYVALISLIVASIYVKGKSAVALARAGEYQQIPPILSEIQEQISLLDRATLRVFSRTYIQPAESTVSLGGGAMQLVLVTSQYISEMQEPSSQEVQDKFRNMKISYSKMKEELLSWQQKMSESPDFYSLLEKKLDLSQLKMASSLFPVVEQLLSMIEYIQEQDEMNMLVLLQNNMELRATGGFMGSFAQISLKKGALQHFIVQDIYEPDGQLEGYVEPPWPLKEYLFQTGGWRLRDANWDPYFPEAAKTISWFFERGGYAQPNLVIAMNLRVVQKLLELTGPLFLVDYNQEITAENIYSFAQVQTEKDFFPGATNKADVLGAIARGLQRTFLKNSDKILPKALQVLSDSFSQKDILVWSKQDELQKAIMVNGWDGSIKKALCKGPNCVPHSLYLVENNLGINKTNCCVERAASYDIWLREDGSVDAELTLHYQNNNPITPIPPRHYGGGYKNYLRIYSDLAVKEVYVGKTKLQSEQIRKEEHQDLGLPDYGMLVEVSGQASETVQVKFSRTEKLDLKKPGEYTLLLQKQPGLQTNLYSVRFHFPQNIKVTELSPSGETLSEQGFLQKDYVVEQNTQASFLIHSQ